MTLPELTSLAEHAVETAQGALPVELRALAAALPVVYHDWPTPEILGEEFEPDILGMFVGAPRNASSDDQNPVPPHILLFLENIWDYADADDKIFSEEVRLTYLHELGHFLGWDEDEVAARGLE